MTLSRARRALPLALALLLWPAAGLAHAEVVPDEVVVRFAADTPAAEQNDVLADAGAESARTLPLPDTHLVELPPGTDEQRAADRLQARPDVVWAEPNYVVEADRTPNDPLFPSLWGLSNTGQTAQQALAGVGYIAQSGTPGFDIGAPATWDVTTGDPAVKVGVVDTGVAAHTDLDGNVDGGTSHDFRAHGAFAIADPRADADGHGTHVAGTIGAIGDNGIGVTGVAWQATLVALRALDAGSGSSADVADAFAYAGAQGIPIVNASLGGPDNSAAIRDAIRDHPNTLYVVAAGNDGVDVDQPGNPSYPCAYGYANVICVASTDNRGDRSYYSNYGATSVDIGAPGNGVLSTYPTFVTPLVDAGTWAHDTGWSHAGSTWTANVTSAPSTLTTDPVNLSTRRGCSVRMTLASSIPSTPDAVSIERSVDGTTWEQIGVRETPTAARAVAYPADADQQGSVRIRVVATSGGPSVSSGVSVKDLQVRCLASGQSSATSTLSGTSMATPMVAGVAALLLSARPGATVAQLRTALLSTATPLPALACSTVTGGQVDAEAALLELTTGATPAAAPGCSGSATPGTGGGGGGGGTTAPAPPVTTPTPITVPTPVATTTAAPPAPTPAPAPAPAPQATLRLGRADLFSDGRLSLRVGVDGPASVRATATLRWNGGHARLAAASRKGLDRGDVATLRLRLGDRATQAIRRARKAGRRVAVRVVVTVTSPDGAHRRVVRSVTLR